MPTNLTREATARSIFDAVDGGEPLAYGDLYRAAQIHFRSLVLDGFAVQEDGLVYLTDDGVEAYGWSFTPEAPEAPVEPKPKRTRRPKAESVEPKPESAPAPKQRKRTTSRKPKAAPKVEARLRWVKSDSGVTPEVEYMGKRMRQPEAVDATTASESKVLAGVSTPKGSNKIGKGTVKVTNVTDRLAAIEAMLAKIAGS